MDINEILNRLDKVTKTSNGYKAQCPNHDDNKPSLDISAKDGKILIYCHAGCDAKDILRKLNLTMKDLFTENNDIHNSLKRKVVCYYNYSNEKGDLLYRKVRYTPKSFSLQRFENGKWLSGIKGIKRVLYNLPEVIKGINKGEPIYIVEGEKDVNTLKKYNKIATCSSFGAGKDKWSKEYNTILKNANVIIIQDNDDIGKEFANAIAISLSDVAKSIKIIDLSIIWKDMPNHEDISDFLKIYSIDTLEKLIYNTQVYENEDVFKDTNYFWNGKKFYFKRDEENKQLGNFFLRVNKEITKDDGINAEKFYEIQPIIENQKLASKIISSKNLNNLGFITELWGLSLRPAIINNVDKFYIDSLRAQYNNIRRMTIYSHTGWKKIKNNWVFLHSGGTVSNENTDSINVELDSKLCKYNFNIPEGINFDINVIYKIFELAPKEVIYPLIGFTFLTPLNSFLKVKGILPSFILYLLGETGCRKSTLASLFISFFGDFNNKDLPSSFKDTANSLEKQGALLRDVITVIDDFHPSISSKEVSLMNATAQHLVRMYGDRTGKSRLDAYCNLKKVYIPQGNAIETGEDLPNIGQSGLSRLLIVELNKDSISIDTLSYIQKNKIHLLYFMRKYIKWIIPRIDDIQETILEKFTNLRENLTFDGSIHGRISESILHLQIGMDMFCEFLTDFTKEVSFKVQEIKESSLSIFKELAENQSKFLNSCDPVNMFITGFRSLFSTQKLKIIRCKVTEEVKNLDSKKTKYSPLIWHDKITIIGYADDKYYYLIFGEAYSKVRELFEKQGEHFPIGKDMLLKTLRKRNYIEPPDVYKNENTCSMNFDGRKKRIVKLVRKYIDN